MLKRFYVNKFIQLLVVIFSINLTHLTSLKCVFYRLRTIHFLHGKAVQTVIKLFHICLVKQLKEKNTELHSTNISFDIVSVLVLN